MSTTPERILSVRITDSVYYAYEQARQFYAIKQSDIVRMAPLLLVLAAEGSLAQRRKAIDEMENKVRTEIQESNNIDCDRITDRLKEIKKEKTSVGNNEIQGQQFIDFLRGMAKVADNEDVVKPDDIRKDEENGLPGYIIFKKRVLRETAQDYVADKIPRNEISDLLQKIDDEAFNKHDPRLLAAAGQKLGRPLDENQKTYLREQFEEALHVQEAIGHLDTGKDNALRQVAAQIARMVPLDQIAELLKQIGDDDPPKVPRRYDGRLLAVARRKLRKPLKLSEKSEIRNHFREALSTIKTRLHPNL